MTHSRLLLDTMLGKLATYLRMCGYDAAYTLDRGVQADEEVLALAREEGRRIVTRDTDLAAADEDAVLIAGKEIDEQLRELREGGFDLALSCPERCSRCNALLERVREGEETPAYAPSSDAETVWRCTDCEQHYWRGSHWDDVRERLESI